MATHTQQAWLCYDQTWRTLKLCFVSFSHVKKCSSSFGFFQPFKNVKIVYSSQAGQKHGCSLPASGHGINTSSSAWSCWALQSWRQTLLQNHLTIFFPHDLYPALPIPAVLCSDTTLHDRWCFIPTPYHPGCICMSLCPPLPWSSDVLKSRNKD